MGTLKPPQEIPKYSCTPSQMISVQKFLNAYPDWEKHIRTCWLLDIKVRGGEQLYKIFAGINKFTMPHERADIWQWLIDAVREQML